MKCGYRIVLQRVAQTIERYGMFRPHQRAGVAVSGGADSVCLLEVLRELAARWQLSLAVLHLDHGLRGEESRQDAEFVRALAGRLELPFILARAELGSAAGNLEEVAREARLQFFREQIAAGAVDSVALGHTRSDQAETVLFRFLRGAGTAGLAGIRPVTGDGIVRPLIDITRAEIEAFLRARGIAWREDSTNSSARFARNRIRHTLLPQLALEWNPALEETLAKTADWALAEEAYWKEETARLALGCLRDDGAAVLAPAEALARLPLAAARRLVRLAIERAKGNLRSIGLDHVDRALEMARAAKGHGRVQAPGIGITRSFDWIRFAPPQLPPVAWQVPAAIPGRIRAPGAGPEIQLELLENPRTDRAPGCVYNSEVGGVDGHLVSGGLVFRNWRPGDRYQPSGHSNEAKIKALFHQARIPIWERAQWPVLASGDAIVWTRRFGPAQAVAAGPASTRILQIREVGRNEKVESQAHGAASIRQESNPARRPGRRRISEF
ncbi:MAG: tRNA lysidine(34) synthetase TilS [Bryobacteraceae bacterium]|jgi:tRNA(Ile)-lysidine synthase